MKIPPELADNVIDELCDDKLALLTSAVVCKGWLSRSRFHLFHTITLMCTAEDFNAPNFLEFLDHSPHLAVYVRILSLQAQHRPRSHLVWFPPHSPIPQHFMPLQLLSSLVNRFPHLSGLEMHGIYWSPAHDPHEVTEEKIDDLHLTAPACPSIRTLTISTVRTVQRIPGFHSIFHLFPNLNTVSIEHSLMHIMFPAPEEATHFPPDVRLDKLTIVGDTPIIPMNKIVPPSAVAQLRELHCPPDYLLHPIVNDAKDGLQTASLDIDIHYDFSLSCCARLHTLRVWSSTRVSNGRNYGIVVPRVLFKSPPTLKRITLILPSGPTFTAEHVSFWDWNHINSMLERFPELELLEVLYTVSSRVSREQVLAGDYEEVSDAGIAFRSIRQRLRIPFMNLVTFGLLHGETCIDMSIPWRGITDLDCTVE
ncbi:hypothetical protein EIP91_004631 [Steccherinum ochraceum]|uniref:F-box domain-containing protein n=1 Tax=Steccherinum ochraceum TaxID=92696 RepID=A0A4R0RND2_9APHY|nr:hypothetical protein EIP91_004631 [Steccherinum ochraceum]